MTIRITARTSESFERWLGARVDVMAGAVRAGMLAAAEGLKLDLRAEIAKAGLGEKLGNAVGSEVYPKNAKGSLGAAGVVFSRGQRADLLLTVHSRGATIRGRSGWLAIPTENVPRQGGRRGGGKPMTPVEVEAAYNQDLRFVPGRRGGGRAVGYLVLDNAVARRSGKGVRAATKGRRHRNRQTAIMFILVRQTTLRSRFRPELLAARWIARAPDLIDRALPTDI